MDQAVENHHRVRKRQPDLLEQLDPADRFQMELRNEEVGGALRKKPQGLLGRAGRQDLHGSCLQMFARPVEEVRIIIGNDDGLFSGIFHRGWDFTAKDPDTILPTLRRAGG